MCLPGQVIQVKVLGILAMVDEGEMDWKVIAINVKDPDSAKLNSKFDLKCHCYSVRHFLYRILYGVSVSMPCLSVLF